MRTMASAAIDGTWIGGCAINQHWVYLEAHFITEAFTLTGTIDMRFEGESDLAITQAHVGPARIRFALTHATGTWAFDGQRTAGVISGTVMSAEEQGTFHLVAVAAVDPTIYDAYVGSYQLEADRVISIAAFRGEAGCPYPVYLDVASGRIGALFPTSATTFVAGPAFLLPFPPELHVTFVSDNERNVAGLRWRQHEGAEQWAPKTLLKREDVSFPNGAIALAGTLTTPARTGSHPAIVLIHGSG